MAQNNHRPNLAALKRLPSLKPTRDVTLSSPSASPATTPSITSAAGKPKFMPNLALAGKRSQATPTAAAAVGDAAKTSASRFGGGGDKANKKPRRGQHEIVQSAGLFAEGVGDATRLSTGRWSAPDSSGGGVSASASRGYQRKSSAAASATDKKMEHMESDEAVLSALLKDNFISDMHSGKISPLTVTSAKLKHELCDEAVEPKRDFCLFDSNNQNSTSSDDSNDSLIVIQLPSVLSEMLSSHNASVQQPAGVKQEIKTEPGTSDSEQQATEPTEEDAQKGRHVLDDVPEGFLGKLQLLKSGKMRLRLQTDPHHEPIFLDVDTSTTSFAQQLVVIDESSQSMNVISENLRHRMLITPDIESIARSLENG